MPALVEPAEAALPTSADCAAEARLLQRLKADWLYLAAFLWLCVLLVLPLWVVDYLPLTDLPEHAAQISMILQREQYEQDYRFNFFTPYLLGYALTWVFAQFFSVITAIKLTLSVCLLAIPCAVAMLLRALRGSRYWVWGAFPVAYGFSFYWGFLNFVVASPVAIAFLAFAVGFGRQPLSLRRCAAAAGFSLLLFFSHALAWAGAVTLAVTILVKGNSWRQVLRRAAAFMVVLPIALYWMSVSGPPSANKINEGEYLNHYSAKVVKELRYISSEFQQRSEKGEHVRRAKEMLSFSIGKPARTDYVVLALVMLCLPLFIGARLTRDWRRWVPLVTTVLLFMIVPYWIVNTAYVYQRFAVFMIPMALILFDRGTQPVTHEHNDSFEYHWYMLKHATVYGLVMLVLIGTTLSFRSFAQSDRDFKAVLGQMQEGRKVLMLAFDQQQSAFLFTPPFMHFSGWYQAEKGGLAIPSFAHDPDAHNVPVRHRGPAWPLPSIWRPGEFNWVRHRGNSFDYFVVRDKDLRADLFAPAGEAVSLVVQHGMWQLYARTDSAATP